ncbi:MAG TPA: hypothetical protein VKJ47_04175 [Candidatus Binatia bacterium]|nr:hypothetical protein [Candidatus Binatia bacterium]
MTATYSQQPLSGSPPGTRKRKGNTVAGRAWGTPSGEDIARVLERIQDSLDLGLPRRPDVVDLLTDCHAMLLRCQAALPAVVEAPRKEEEAA